MNDKNKRTLTIISIFIMMITLVGGTFAYWKWITDINQQTEVTFTMEKEFSCSVDGGGDITPENISLEPSTCGNPNSAIKRKIVVTPDIKRNELEISMDLWLNINSIGTGLANSDNFKYVLTTSEDNCTTDIVKEGNFKGKKSGDIVMLLEKNYTADMNETYYLYIWLDSAESLNSTTDQTFDFSLGGVCSNYLGTPETPALEPAMIPVTIANDGTVTTVSKDDPNWYNYENKQWANIVLVKENATDGVANSHPRSYYQNNIGEVVTQDDILAHYVWIPRYKYKMPPIRGGTIDIAFEAADEMMKLGDATTEYRSHPAFWWDNDSDGIVDSNETLPGIWVGKFETTPDKESECYTNPSTTTCNNSTQNPTILPNISSLRSQYISNQFYTSQRIASNGNIYGFNSNFSSHMMKNSEWGAVAYLSHSEYGLIPEPEANGETDGIRVNNNWHFITGCGATVYNAPNVAECQLAYGTQQTYPQSTTGNISGIFDMSGGAWEYVMGNFNKKITWRDRFDSLPLSRYYDAYSLNENGNGILCTLETCGGHALNETYWWDLDDPLGGIRSDFPWLVRGGSCGESKYAGLFYTSSSDGSAYDSYSWRSVLLPGFGN